MVVYHKGTKPEKKETKKTIAKSTAIPAKVNVFDVTTPNESIAEVAGVSKKPLVAVPISVQKKVSSTQLIQTMNLDEMLEASSAVEKAIMGSNLPKIKSLNAKKYVNEILLLNQKTSTRSRAEEMLRDLNTQIIKVNKQTTDATESKRLYRELMAEE